MDTMTPQQRYAAAHPERVKAAQARYLETHPDRRRVSIARYLANHTEQAEASRRRWKASAAGLTSRLKPYGITAADYAALLLAQGGVCAICHQPAKGGRTSTARLHVDHDHGSGKVRGLLCNKCNLAIGHLSDQGLLQAAADYLRRS
jgi:hypothetical protein